MSPRTGRPTEDPKKLRLELRLSDSQAGKLNYCCEYTGLTKAEVIRLGIDKVFEDVKKEEKK